MGRLSLTLFSFAGLLCCVSSMFGHQQQQQQYKTVAPGSPSSNTNPAPPPPPQQQYQNSWSNGAYPPQQSQQPWSNGGYIQQPPPPPGPPYGGYPPRAPYEPPIMAPMAPPAPPSDPTPVGGTGAGANAGATGAATGGAPGITAAGAAAAMRRPPAVAIQFMGQSMETACAQMRIKGSGYLADEIPKLVRFRFPTKAAAMLTMLDPVKTKAEVGGPTWACAMNHYATHTTDIAGAFSDLVDGGCDFTCTAGAGPVHNPMLKMARLLGGGAMPNLGNLFKGIAPMPVSPMFPPAPGAGGPGGPSGHGGQGGPLAMQGPPMWGGNSNQHNPRLAHAPMPYDPVNQNMALGKPFPQAGALAGQSNQQQGNMYGQQQQGNQYPGQGSQPNNNNQPPHHPPHNAYGGHLPGNQYPTQAPQTNNNNQSPPHPQHNQYGGHLQINKDPTQPPQPHNNNQPQPHPPHNPYGGHLQGNPYSGQGPQQPNNNNQYSGQQSQTGSINQPPHQNNMYGQPNNQYGQRPPTNQLPQQSGIELTMPGSNEKIELDPAIANVLKQIPPANRKRFVNDAITSFIAVGGMGSPSGPGPNGPPNGMSQNGYPAPGMNTGPQTGTGMSQPGPSGSGMNQNGFPPKDATQVSGQYNTGGFPVNLGTQSPTTRTVPGGGWP